MEEIKTGVTTVQGYRSLLSNEIFLDEKEALQSDNAIRQRFAPGIIERLMDQFLFKELKKFISDEIADSRELKDKVKFNKLTDLQEIVYNPSNANRSNQYFTKSPMQIATDMEILLSAMTDSADNTNQGYYDDKQIALLYERSKGDRPDPGVGSHLKSDGSYAITFRESGSAGLAAQTMMMRVGSVTKIEYLQATSASVSAALKTYQLADIRLTPDAMKANSFVLSIKTVDDTPVEVAIGSAFIDDTWNATNMTIAGIPSNLDITITWSEFGGK